MLRACLFAALLLTANPALAGASVKFAPYEGKNSIVEGEGGTKVSKNGIDYWNTGAPPRRYQILGVITDKRYDDWDGSAIGSAKVARVVIKAGGNAVIVMNAQIGGGGSYAMPTGGGSYTALGLDKATTQLIVVKYLD